MTDKKPPQDGKQEPQDVTDTELDQVSGGKAYGKTLQPQPLPPITL